MSSKIALLFNHKITPQQERELTERWGVGEIILLPPDLQTQWAQIDVNENNLALIAQPFINWLRRHLVPNDFILIMGEMGTCFYLVDWALANGFVPLHTTTYRQVTIEQTNQHEVKIERIINHQQFRKYQLNTKHIL